MNRSYLTPEQLAEVIATIPACRLSAADLDARLTWILRTFEGNELIRSVERGEDRRKLAQTMAAAEKLQGLLWNDGVRSAAMMALVRQAGDEVMDGHAFFEVRERLPELIAELKHALETPRDVDVRRDDALAELVTSLALLWVDATGEPMSYPGFDDATGRYGVAFVAFLNFFTAATDCAFVDDAPTDEAIRHKLREAIERGDISQKSARPRLSQAPPEAPTLVSIETNQVVTSHDDEARGDLGRGDQSGGA